MVPPVVAPAPTIVCISSMNRIGSGRFLSAADDRLEALLEVAAVARAGEERAGVEGEDLGALQRPRARRPASSRWARPSTSAVLPTPALADEDRVVLAPAAQHLERALHLGARGRSAGRARPARARSVRFDRVGGERVARGPRLVLALAGGAPARLAARRPAAATFETPWEM